MSNRRRLARFTSALRQALVPLESEIGWDKGAARPFVGDGVRAGGRLLGYRDEGMQVINLVADCGADPTGATSSDAAFALAGARLRAAMTLAGIDASTKKRSNVALYLPPGEYLVTADDPTAMATAMTGGGWGWHLIGAGWAVTRIRYRPAGDNYRLFYNNDRWGYGRITGLEVNCDNPTAIFMDVASYNNVYSWHYDLIRISGTWSRGWSYHGSNLGSEQSFHRIEAPGTRFVGGACFWVDAAANDQFVNYWFDQCSVGPQEGDGWYFAKGGSVDIRGGSWSAWSGRTTQGYFIRLPTGDHGNGAMRLTVANLRIEYKDSGLMGLISCAWKAGTILFDSIHDNISYYNGGEQPAGLETAQFSASNAPGPTVTWRSCVLSGKHRYDRPGVTAWTQPAAIAYQQCVLAELTTPETFIVYAAPAPIGGGPVVRFTDCIDPSAPDGPGADRLISCTLNWHRHATGSPTLLTRIFTAANGNNLLQNPQTIAMRLPLNAVIVRIKAYKPAGGSQTSGGNYTVTNGDGDTVATLAVPAPWNGAWHTVQELGYVADTATRRQLTLASGFGENSFAGGVIVEYLA